MVDDASTTPFYVIRAAELPALNCLDHSCPQPFKIEWINRGTNRHLRPTSVDLLLRTLFHRGNSPSVVELHESAGLRAFFRTEIERRQFAAAFTAARGRA